MTISEIRKRPYKMRILSLLLVFGFVISFAYSADAGPQAPPTNIRKDAPAAMTPKQAKLALGFPEALAEYPLDTGAKFVFTIIDMGFVGFDEWLEAHPEFKERVHYKNMRKTEKSKAITHGFDVFRTALSVMPNAEFILLEVDGTQHSVNKALAYMPFNESYFASMSLGSGLYIGEVAEKPNWLKWINQNQITLFISTGNSRKMNHFFTYQDKDGDGLIEFDNAETLLEDNKVYLVKGMTPQFILSWNEWPKSKSTVELQLLKDGEIVSRMRPKGTQPVIRLDNFNVAATGYYTLRLKALEITKPGQLKFSLFVVGAGTRQGVFNGLQSLNSDVQYESPFLIAIGAFGLDSDGKVETSLFSSLGRTNKGKISPHILGPGQLIIDGETHNGTSFSTPYIAALYSIYADYNIKNMIEETSGYDAFKTGLTPIEQGRWGCRYIVNFSKITVQIQTRLKTLPTN